MRELELNIPAETREKFTFSTSRVMLALSTSLTLQATRIPYISYIVDNWQTMGCDIQDLANDVYQQITTAPFLPGHP